MSSFNNQPSMYENFQYEITDTSKGKVRLLKFVCDFGTGGTEGQILNLVKGLGSTDFELEFASLKKEGAFVEEYEKQGIAISEFPITSLYSPLVLLQMMRFAKHLRNSRITIMHAYNFYSLVFSIPAAKMAGVPVIIASIRDRGVYLTRKQKLLQRLVCLMADRILVNADSIRDWLLDEGYQQKKITVIKNGIDSGRYEMSSNNKNDAVTSIRGDCGVTEDAPLIVMLSRLNRQKGVLDIIQAAARVKSEHPDAKFLLIGRPSLESQQEDSDDPSDQQQWLNLRDELDLGDTLFFCGHRSDIPQILSQASVSVLPSHSEGLSNTLLESMAAGVPVVATCVGGTPELVEDGVDGILIPPHSPDLLAKAISRILSSKALSQRLSNAARIKVREEFSLEAMVETTKEVYASQLERTEVPS